MCYQLEKLMKENADKLSDDDRQPLETAIAKTREVAKSEDTAAIKSAINELEQASQAFTKALYERAQSASESPQSNDSDTTGGSGDDDAIDAEFEVKD